MRSLSVAAFCGLLAGLMTGPAPALDGVARMVTEAEAPAFRAVGRLNVAGNRHCTATLISDQLVLTAAHCLFNPLTGRRAQPGDMRFVAGQRGESYAALRGVADAVVLPGYVFHRLPFGSDAARDVALLRLDVPIPGDTALPLPTGIWDQGDTVALLGFGRDRAYVASLREGCRATSRKGALAVLDCAAVPGLSGAPVLRAGPSGPVVVGMVSASVRKDGSAVVIVLSTRTLETLKRALLGTEI